MRDVERRLSNLKRPKLMVEAAQNRLTHYNSERYLPSSIAKQETLGPNGSIYCMFKMEDAYIRLQQ
jgi:hypothetical protein